MDSRLHGKQPAEYEHTIQIHSETTIRFKNNKGRLKNFFSDGLDT